jgi:hypothetical protein
MIALHSFMRQPPDSVPGSRAALDRDRPLVLQIGGQVDRSHTAATQLLLERVSAFERGGETIRRIGHEKSSG